MATTPQPQDGSDQSAEMRSSQSASEDGWCCASPLSPLPQHLFSRLRALASSCQSSQDYGPLSHLGEKVQRRNPCCLKNLPASSSQTTESETLSPESTYVEYEEWALHQINEARDNPCIKVFWAVARNEDGRLSLQPINNSPAAIKSFRTWLASAATADEDRRRKDSLISAGLTAVKIFSSPDHNPAETASLSSAESLELVDPEVAADGGFWMDVGTAASRPQTGDLLDFRLGTEEACSRPLLQQQGPNSSCDVLLPWDI